MHLQASFYVALTNGTQTNHVNGLISRPLR